MEIIARASFIRTSPRKLRLVADAVKSLGPDRALLMLKNLRKRAAGPLFKVLKQAQSNAVNNFKLAKDKLVIKTIEVNGGPIYKRGRAVSKGRGHSIKKRTSHIKIVLEGQPAAEKNGPKSKS